jgi:hypothetical protein
MRFFYVGVVSVLLAAASLAHSKEVVIASPKIVPISPPRYEAISFATTGPAHTFSDSAARGKYQRLVVLDRALGYDLPTLRLETLTYGDEGCCTTIVAAWELDLNELRDLGVSLPDAATTRLRFSRWHSARVAEFQLGELKCQFEGVGLPRVKVSCAKYRTHARELGR